MDPFSFLNAVHAEFIDEMYQQYQKYPDSVEPSWKSFFQGFDFASTSYNGQAFIEAATQNTVVNSVPEDVQKEFKVINLIDGYRSRGHLFTKTNPVRERRKYTPDLSLANFGLSEADLDTSFKAGEVLGLGGPRSLREIVAHLEKIYCNSIGIEYMYIRDPEMRKWIQEWINANINQPQLTEEEKRNTLRKLNSAVAFENFLHTKFVGQKRFSLEGNESLIPAMDSLIERSADLGVDEFVVGMAHRGRLNVLANVFGKSYTQIFSEFEGKDFENDLFAGDVKYHLGSTSKSTTYKGKQVKLNLAPNPSHLETVGPVVEGIVRAKVDLDYTGDYKKILPILIHGDAAIAGQGIVYEVIQMMTLDGYKTGGTVHIVVNNQIGFTTNYLDGRSSTYCTDVGKVTLSPVLHVNADDVEAVVHAMHFAADFRNKWGRDVFIDLLGYRKYGHNEGDEPRFTQPLLYKAIAKHPNPREIYKEKLLKGGVVGEAIVKEMEEEFKAMLDADFDASKEIEKNKLEPFMPDEWEGFELPSEEQLLADADTKFPQKDLEVITETLTELPTDGKFIRKIERLLQQRKEMVANNAIDWGMAELLAYGSLLKEGFNVRLSGEDVERGTFSHRHAVIKSEDDSKEVVLLNHIPDAKGKFEAYNSLLSEYAVLGYDYGYALAAPNTLTIWEAQFGDFSNGGQIIIDQYISAAEDKWLMQNGLVMLLPHGYEGQGAEHSSGRLERYLQLCADNNMFIANCTTPANFYHLLRRQMQGNFRKPLIVFTPKSLLRHPKVVSSLKELSDGGFQTVIDDKEVTAKNVKRVVLCSGKIYYDLLEEREKNGKNEVALVRLEQLYPLDRAAIEKLRAKYPKKVEWIWAQEEPENMGAWGFILRKFREYNFQLISPPESGAPAPGSSHRHKISHGKVISAVFDLK